MSDDAPGTELATLDVDVPDTVEAEDVAAEVEPYVEDAEIVEDAQDTEDADGDDVIDVESWDGSSELDIARPVTDPNRHTPVSGGASVGGGGGGSGGGGAGGGRGRRRRQSGQGGGGHHFSIFGGLFANLRMPFSGPVLSGNAAIKGRSGSGHTGVSMGRRPAPGKRPAANRTTGASSVLTGRPAWRGRG